MVLRHPDQETVKWLEKGEHHRWPEILTVLTQDPESPFVKATQRLAKALDITSIAEWTKEYEQIFGHSVQSAAPPYELEYGEEHSHRQPQELGDIAAFYQAFGLQLSALAHERVDHVVTECEFMQYLLYKQACALDEGQSEHVEIGRDAAKQFLVDHLGRWGPAFALRLSRVTHGGVLEAVAQLTLEWLMLESARMQVPYGPHDLPLRQPKEQDDIGCAACEFKQSENMGGGDGNQV